MRQWWRRRELEDSDFYAGKPSVRVWIYKDCASSLVLSHDLKLVDRKADTKSLFFGSVVEHLDVVCTPLDLLIELECDNGGVFDHSMSLWNLICEWLVSVGIYMFRDLWRFENLALDPIR